MILGIEPLLIPPAAATPGSAIGRAPTVSKGSSQKPAKGAPPRPLPGKATRP